MLAALRFAKLPLQVTVVFVVALLVFPAHAGLAGHIYIVLLAAIALGRLVQVIRRTHPPMRRSAFDAALRKRPRTYERPDELQKIEREVALGAATAFDLHYRLRPSLRGIADELLAARRGIDLEANPAAARRELGEEAWEIVRPDREPPIVRFGAGVDVGSLRTAVAALERL
jgi:predicted amidohydrolase